MTKQTFRERLKENNANFKRGMAEGRVETATKKAELKAEWNGAKADHKVAKEVVRKNAPVGFEQTKRTLVNGFALWLAIPAIVVIIIATLLIGVGIWDWVTGLFS